MSIKLCFKSSGTTLRWIPMQAAQPLELIGGFVRYLPRSMSDALCLRSLAPKATAINPASYVVVL